MITFISSQTASLFYDQIKINDYDSDIPLLFQNYSRCFLDTSIQPKKINSTNQKYRTIDGTENNPNKAMMGASFTSYGRLLKAQYNDNIHSIRKSIRGYNLPSPRNIVRKLFLNDEVNLNKFKNRKKIPNMAAVMFGQYIAHDVGSRQASQYIDGLDGIRCCANFNKIHLPSSLLHSACLPITISRSDPVYSPKDVKCMGFVRSNMISNSPYQVEVGEKANTVTSFLDHSNIYGSDFKTLKKVRSYNGGRLRTNIRNVLPLNNGSYFSGDDRVNQTPFLAIWHSIFVRSHNHLADNLAAINRKWDEEKIFQEARKINIAIFQKIIYEEWLPIFLGKNACTRFENVTYDANIDASNTNEFSATSFRFMHSFINSEFILVDEDMKSRSLNLSDTITKPKLLENFYDDTWRGLLKQKMKMNGYSSEILNKMFKNKKGLGLDLMSVDIQRGRDHGVPAYTKFRKMCNMKSNIKVFNDLAPYVPSSGIVQLRQTYKSVFDIDLLVAGALESIPTAKNETEDDSGFFGPTFQCIIGEQFQRLKAGDSLFYSHPKHFTNGKYAPIITMIEYSWYE